MQEYWQISLMYVEQSVCGIKNVRDIQAVSVVRYRL
jgi:hypothetical protein